MKRNALLVAIAVACKAKEVPYVPPPPEDAKSPVADAAPPTVDAPAAARAKPIKVAVGDHVSCAVMSDGTARCWGRNSDGQLGDGTTTDRASPVTVPIRGVTDVVLGTAHACALLDDTSVTCWGRINYGAKGMLMKPTAVPGLQKATRIFAVGTASCATLSDGPFVCWGNVDPYGRFRPAGAPSEHRVPAPVPELSRVIAVTATGALFEDGRARWFADKLVLEDVIEIAADGQRLCGLRRDGVVGCAGPRYCAWPKKTKEPAPAIEELALPGAKRLAFDRGICVVTQSGKVQCLDPKDGCRASDPVRGLSDVESVHGACALTRSGGVKCESTSVAGVARVSAIVGTSSHVCVLSTDRIVCLGANKHGALGRGEVTAGLHLDSKPVSF